MTKEHTPTDENEVRLHKSENLVVEKRQVSESDSQTPISALQQQVGNRAVQRLLAQPSGNEAFELDDETAGRINSQRGSGQPLENALQAKLGDSMGQDFSSVRVHTSRESDELNQQLSAKAFTTGQDIFFRAGDYDPGSSSGQELIAHELTHVVQQSSGAVGGSGGGMMVNAPGDAFEQEADVVAKTVMNNTGAGVEVQRQEMEEDEEDLIQQQPMEEEEEEIV